MVNRAVQIDRRGGPEVLDIREVPVPTLRPGEVLVRTSASSINPVDWKTREWERGPDLPATLGWDLAGVVVATAGAGFRPGDRVVAMSNQLATGRGTWANFVALPANLLVALPATVPLVEAATLPLAGMTAAQVADELEMRPGVRVLVAGAVGGVGSLFLQLALLAGAEVDALVSRTEHLTALARYGAGLRATADPGTLRRHGYDAVVDTAGLQRVGIDVGALLASGGRYLSITDDPLPDLPGAGTVQVREDGAQLARLVGLVGDGLLRLRVAERFPVDQVRAAHRLFEAGGLVGKVVLTF